VLAITHPQLTKTQEGKEALIYDESKEVQIILKDNCSLGRKQSTG